MKVIIEKIENEVKNKFTHESTGHDWHHINRVRNMALHLHEFEGGNRDLIEIASLLHDIADYKLTGGDLYGNGEEAKRMVLKFGGTEDFAERVMEIVDATSFKGAKVPDNIRSIESAIVQDADRLDAIGAIGIARTFAYGGNKNQPIYNEDLPPVLHDSFEQYAKGNSHTINHFYEKLLLLKDRMNTDSAKIIAIERHEFMLKFLDEFYKEWNFDKHN
jgi:uncharacterized protein